MSAQHIIELPGCTPTPLAGYLKALGVLRLLGEQKPEWDVRGAWRGDRLVLKSSELNDGTAATRHRLADFFLAEYRPTPIVAPWNGGSGFYPKDNCAGIDALASSQSERFANYREAIEFCRKLVARHHLAESPKNEAKAAFLSAIRAEAPEAMLAWQDAAVLLAGEEPRYPPLLGTGGNDGRLDFTNNFMQRLIELVKPASGEPTPAARMWLPAALFGEATSGMASVAVGQFHPGGAGGPNASAGFEGGSLVNPWDFVLMLEGALLFAAAVTRRLESAEPGMLAYPFTVRPSGAGSGGIGTTDESQARAEIWLPLWSGFAGVRELKALLSEGRATLGRRLARDGLGFARAVAGLGVDRGIGAFQRYGFLMRSGKAYLATPLTRIAVRRNPNADLFEQLETGHFLDRLRRFGRDEQAPARIRTAVRRLEDALFDLAQKAERVTLQRVLVHLGTISLTLAKSHKGRDAVPELPMLSEDWVLKADDGSPEFRCAAALAGLGGDAPPMRPFVVPVRRDERGAWIWDTESRLAVWGEGHLAANLGRVIARRRIEATKETEDSKPFHFRAGAASSDVAAWLVGGLDETRLADLFAGLVHARIPENFAGVNEYAALPAAYAVLKPFFVPDGLLVYLELLTSERCLPLPGEIITRLQADRVQDAVELAWRRLPAAGFPLPRYPRTPPTTAGLDGPRLLAALAVPLTTGHLAHCLNLLTRLTTQSSESFQGETP